MLVFHAVTPSHLRRAAYGPDPNPHEGQIQFQFQRRNYITLRMREGWPTLTRSGTVETLGILRALHKPDKVFAFTCTLTQLARLGASTYIAAPLHTLQNHLGVTNPPLTPHMGPNIGQK